MMAKTWAEQMTARRREEKRKEREKRARIRRRKVQAVVHPVRTARRRIGL